MFRVAFACWLQLLHYTRSFTVKMSAGNVCHPRDLRLFQIPVMLSSIIAKLLVSAVTEINQLVYDYCADLLRHKTAASCGRNRSCTVLLTTVWTQTLSPPALEQLLDGQDEVSLSECIPGMPSCQYRLWRKFTLNLSLRSDRAII